MVMSDLMLEKHRHATPVGATGIRLSGPPARRKLADLRAIQRQASTDEPKRPVVTSKDRSCAKRTVDFIVPQINDPGVGVELSAFSHDGQYDMGIYGRDGRVNHLEIDMTKARFQQDL